jgi:hypothetical protein
MITTRERENWEGKPQEQVVEELASYSIETQGIPDVFYWQLDAEGRLRTPDGRIIEREIIRHGYPYSLEYQGLLEIQDWARRNEDGFAAWISSRLPVYYPDDSKIVVSEIISQEGGKIIFNRSMRFDISPEDCLKLARSLGENPGSPDDLRKSPIFLGKTWTGLLFYLREITDTSKVEEDIREGRDFEAKRQAITQSREIIRQDPSLRNVQGLAPSGFFGHHPVSCPPRGAFSTFSENAFNLGPEFFLCPKCERPIPARRGITICPHCGARKEDSGSKCD